MAGDDDSSDSGGTTAGSAAGGGATVAPTEAQRPRRTTGSTGGTGEVDTNPLVIARNMDLTSLDPHRLVCDTCQFVFTSLYQTLIGLDTDNKTLIPNLAESWEISDDNTVFTFHLAPEATFSDGSPVEAKDVAFSLLRLKNLKVSLTYLVDDIQTIETPDDKTVVVTLGIPNAEFLNNMNAAYPVIVNSDVAIENGATDAEDADTTDTAEAWFIENSAGSGPYVLDSFTTGDQITMTANPNYWKDPAPIATVTVQQVETAAAQAQMLQTGDADIAMQIDPITAQTLDGVDSVTVETIPSFNFLYLALFPGITAGTTVPSTTRCERRSGRPSTTRRSPTRCSPARRRCRRRRSPTGSPGRKASPRRRPMSRVPSRLLESAGVSDMTMTLGYPAINAYGIDFSQLAQVIQQQLAEVGITLELDPQTFAVFIDKFRAFDYSSNLLYWAPDYFGSAQYVSYFGLVEGARAAKNAAASDENPLIDPVTQEAYDEARASSDRRRARDAVQHRRSADARPEHHHPADEPGPRAGLSVERRGRDVQRLLQPRRRPDPPHRLTVRMTQPLMGR